MKDWGKYEKKIFNKLNNEFKGSNIQKNAYIEGQFSKTKRQIDILIKGELTGHDLLGVVDCKYFNKNVDVTIVDSFIGFLEDIKANFGIIITNKGFSEAAKNRASVKNIKLSIVNFEKLEEYTFEWDECSVCYPGPDKPPTLINWDDEYEINRNGKIITLKLGRCDWCNSIHVKCGDCGAVTPVPINDYGRIIECEGCGLKFKIISKHIEKGMCEEYLEAGE